MRMARLTGTAAAVLGVIVVLWPGTPSATGNQIQPPIADSVPPRLTAEWWQWVLSVPASVNPLTEVTGERCFVGQRGPVWLLGGDFSGADEPIERTCTVPFGKSLLMPVINAVCSTAEGDANPGDSFVTKTQDLTACVTDLIDQVTGVKALFGPADRHLQALEVERVLTAPFDITFPPSDDVLGLDPADPNPTLAVAEGFWVLVPPPPAPGSYDLKVLGEFDQAPQDGVPDFVQDVTYRIEFVAPQ